MSGKIALRIGTDFRGDTADCTSGPRLRYAQATILQAERFAILARALERMPLKRRRPVLLNRFEGLSYAQIGEQFQLKSYEGGVKVCTSDRRFSVDAAIY